MTQADSVHSTPPTNTSLTRRNMLGAFAGASVASVGSLAAVDDAAKALSGKAVA